MGLKTLNKSEKGKISFWKTLRIGRGHYLYICIYTYLLYASMYKKILKEKLYFSRILFPEEAKQQ